MEKLDFRNGQIESVGLAIMPVISTDVTKSTSIFIRLETYQTIVEELTAYAVKILQLPIRIL